RNLEWPGPVAPLKPDLELALGEYLARNKQCLELLHEAAGLEKSRYPIHWGNIDPHNAVWLNLGRCRSVGTVLQFEALLAAEHNNITEAAHAIQAEIALARFMGQERSLAGQFYRGLYLNLSISALERVLNREALPDQDLANISADLRQALIATGPA